MDSTVVHKRRITVVDRPFQYKLSLGVLAAFAASAVAVWWETRHYVQDLSARGIIANPDLMVVLDQYSQLMFLKILVGGFLVWCLALYFSNRIAGPLYHLKKSLQKLREGDLTERIFLRKFDQFQYVANSFNEAVEHLRDIVQNERQKALQLSEKIEQAAKKSPPSLATEILEISSAVKRLNDDFKI